MRINSLSIRDYGPIRELDCVFKPGVNTIIGYNGAGKTTIIELLAALTGKKRCVHFANNREVGSIRLSVVVDGNGKTFQAKGRLEAEQMLDFRKHLGSYCSNFGQDENGSEVALSGVCDFAAAQADIKRFLDGPNRTTSIFQVKGALRMPMGDGYQQYIRLIHMKNMIGGPLLLDMPERHLDIVAKRRMYYELCAGKEQVILSTHTPEFLSSEENIIDLS